MARRADAVMAGAGYATVWEFTVDAGRRAEFERHYGPDGSWARLFRRAQGYLGTELLRDRSNPSRYLTIDRWESREAWQAFRGTQGTDYERLDRELESLTTHEAPLGEFSPAATPNP